MFNMKKTCVAFLSAAFGAVAVSGQTCAEVDANGTAFFPVGTKAIADGAFEYCTSLKSVEIPASVEIVEDYTFSSAFNLASVTFAAGSMVQSLGRYAFSYTSIETIILPDGLRDLGDNAFRECKKLKSVEIPAPVKIIGDNTFLSAVNLASVTFAAGSMVQSLGRYAFMYCESLKSVEIPASVEIVGDYAFYFADSLETLTFAPGSVVQSLGKRAFGFCDSLKSVEIPASVEIVGDFTFFKAINLASVTFAAGSLIQSLGQYAFSGTSIETIILPDGLRDLGGNVFTTSNSLRNIILPNSITSKETGAYYFKDTCVANLQALDNFFSVETKPTNLIVCACVQVANIFECPALRQHSCSKYDKRNCKKDKGNRCKWNKKNKRKNGKCHSQPCRALKEKKFCKKGGCKWLRSEFKCKDP